MKMELESLNLDDLDVEELERRLELAPTVGTGTGVGDCTVQNTCSSQCAANVWWVCSG